MFACRPVAEDFFEKAPLRAVNAVLIPATATDIFAELEDETSWPHWYKPLRNLKWKTPRPQGEGSRRSAQAAIITVHEYFFRWEPNRRLSFYLTDISVPMFGALAEDYLLEEIAPGRTRFTYTMAAEPRLLFNVGRPLTPALFDLMAKGAAHGLLRYMNKQTARVQERQQGLGQPVRASVRN
jgi:Polyketide cyclase / dehydrase and lipid transport